MKLIFYSILLFLTVAGTGGTAFAQTSVSGANVISTAVPFLMITPDSRSGGMGDAGIASSPDVNSQHYNPAKYAFAGSDAAVGLSYTPWLRNLVKGINLGYLSGYRRLDDLQVLSASLRYFDYGEVPVNNGNGDYQGTANPNEWAVDFGYIRRLSGNFSGSVVLRYIRSDLSGGQLYDGVETGAGNAVAADIAFYYQGKIQRNRLESVFSAGIDISNIGTKISYTGGTTKDFIPANLRIGVGYQKELDPYNGFSFNVDLNKLLVPAPVGTTTTSSSGILVGNDFSEDKSVVEGIFSSFTDASFKEELEEITVSLGVEYWYDKKFAMRTGYFHENRNKGNRKFITAGIGATLKEVALDFSYLVPTERDHPLSNTIRVSVSYRLGPR